MKKNIKATAIIGELANLAEAMGVSHINKLPGLWECKIDEKWSVKVNGHAETVENLPPYRCLVEYNGWPAGVVSPFDGVIAAGVDANEDALIKAIRKKIKLVAKEA